MATWTSKTDYTDKVLAADFNALQTLKADIKKATAANLGTLDAGEFGLETDTRRVLIGSSMGNQVIKGDYITPEMYGALTTKPDNSTELQAAIDASIINDKVFYVPSGRYRHSATLRLHVGSKAINIAGNGGHDFTGAAASGLMYTGTGTGYTLDNNGALIWKFRVRGVGFFASAMAAIGIHAKHISQTYIDDIGFWAWAPGEFATNFRVEDSDELFVKHPIVTKGGIGFDLINTSVVYISDIDCFATEVFCRMSGTLNDIHINNCGIVEMIDYFLLLDDSGPGGAVTLRGLWVDDNHVTFNRNQLGYTGVNQQFLKIVNGGTLSMIAHNIFLLNNNALSAGGELCTTDYPIEVDVSATTGPSTVIDITLVSNRFESFHLGVGLVINDAGKTSWHFRDTPYTGVAVSGAAAVDIISGSAGCINIPVLKTPQITADSILYINSNHESGIIFQNGTGGNQVVIAPGGIAPVADNTKFNGVNTQRWQDEYVHHLHIGPASVDNASITEEGTIDTTDVYKVDGIQVVGAQAAAQADLKADYTTGDLDSEAEIIAAINATNAAFNTLLAKQRTHGLIAT